MSDHATVLYEATHRGYVTRRVGQALVWQAFHKWCMIHAQPYVYIDLTRTYNRGATVGIDLFPTSGYGRTGDRFTLAARTEASVLLAQYHMPAQQQTRTLHTITPISIRHVSVLVEQAEALAQALLALYRRMKAREP